MTKDNLFMPLDHMDQLYNSSNPLVRMVHRDRINTIANQVPNAKTRILDAGCGEGHLIELLHAKYPDNEYFGIDVTEIALKKAKKRCRFAELKHMDLSSIKFKDGFFDVLICTEVLEHITDYRRVLSEFRRVIRKGGFLILTFPNEFMWTASRFVLRRKPVKVPDHVNSFTPRHIDSMLDMELVKQINLPLRLPFFMSLGALLKFQKI
jgi:ubiquinone/menaquinone biosynthesis C-methylase UbiE